MPDLVTLIGGGGFIGRYAAQSLLKRGARVRVVGRDPKRAFFLKPLGGLGQTQFVAADVTKPASIARAVQGSDVVVNLVGLLAGDFSAVHARGARTVAEEAASAGARAFVQVSAIGADPTANSAYARTKGEGEQAVRAAFPAAAILRPSIVFGAEDHFLNRFAKMMQLSPAIPVIAGATQFQPVFVADVGRAIAAAALEPGHAGKTYELGGPRVLTMAALMREIARMVDRAPLFLDLPDALGEMIAKFGFLPGAPITMDQWKMLSRDNIVTPGTPGLGDFAIEPTAIEAIAPSWLVEYRQTGRFGAARKAA